MSDLAWGSSDRPPTRERSIATWSSSKGSRATPSVSRRLSAQASSLAAVVGSPVPAASSAAVSPTSASQPNVCEQEVQLDPDRDIRGCDQRPLGNPHPFRVQAEGRPIPGEAHRQSCRPVGIGVVQRVEGRHQVDTLCREALLPVSLEVSPGAAAEFGRQGGEVLAPGPLGVEELTGVVEQRPRVQSHRDEEPVAAAAAGGDDRLGHELAEVLGRAA